MLSYFWLPPVILCCIALIFKSTRNRINQPPLPPGPRGLPVVGMLPFPNPQLHTYFTHLAHTYGPIMSLRVGMKTMVVVSSPSLAKLFLKDFDVTFANHDVTVAANEFSYGGNDLVFCPYSPKWTMLRKVCVNGLLGHAIVDAASNARKELMQQTIRKLHEHANCSIDIGEQMFLNAYNIIMSMLWGKAAEKMETAREEVEFRRVVGRAVVLLGTPNVSDFFPGLAMFDIQGTAKKMKECVNRLGDLIEVAIQDCSKMDCKENDDKSFLKFLLQFMAKDEKDNKLSMAQLKGVIIGMIVAGTESISNTVEFAMAELLDKPEVMAKAQHELEMVVGADNIVEESHIQQLPYLKAIMNETLRLYPPAPLLISYPKRILHRGRIHYPKGCAGFFQCMGHS